MSTKTGTAVLSATGHPQLVEPVARLHVPALTQPEAVVSLDSGEQIINKNQNWHMRAWLTVDKQSGALTGYCRTWWTDNSVFGAGFHGGVSVNFVDAQGNLVSYLPPQRYGVSGGWDFTGPHDRSDSFPARLTRPRPRGLRTSCSGLATTPTHSSSLNWRPTCSRPSTSQSPPCSTSSRAASRGLSAGSSAVSKTRQARTSSGKPLQRQSAPDAVPGASRPAQGAWRPGRPLWWASRSLPTIDWAMCDTGADRC